MTRPLSLAHLTVIDLAPPEMIRTACDIGYDAVGLRLIRVTDTSPGYALMDDPAMMRETKAALKDSDVFVNDIEFVKFTPDIDLDALLPFLDAGAELGARHVICAPYDDSLTHLSENLGKMQELCSARGMRAVLEFFPWTNVPNLSTCLSVVEASHNSNLGVLVDCLHFNRSNSQLADLAMVDASRLPFFHLCDAPVFQSYSTDDLFHAGRAERLAPGDGQIDLAQILAQLPPDIPAGLEVPMSQMAAAHGTKHVARHVFDKARAFLNDIPPVRDA